MNARAAILFALVSAVLAACQKRVDSLRVHPTCATVDVLHGDVTVSAPAQSAATPRVQSRVEINGSVLTGPSGRAVLRTDDGIELRLAGSTEVRFADGRARVDHGRAFVSSWGDDERSLGVGAGLTLGLGDAAVEVERTSEDDVRIVTVRGEVAWRLPTSQGRLQQGDELQGRGVPTQQPASVWDDWTGGAASPQGAAHHGVDGAGAVVLHTDDGEAPVALAVNEHHVSVRVTGDVAVTTVSQTFFNGSDSTAAAEYRIRLPESAVLSSFAVERDGAIQRARVAAIGAVVRSGSAFGALLQAPDGSLLAQLDPLVSGSTVRCEVQYVQWLTHDTGHRTYVYPGGDPIAPQLTNEFEFELTADSSAGVATLRGPVGAEIQGPHLHYARSDYRPRGDLSVDLFDSRPASSASARLWRSQGSVDGRSDYVLVDVNLPPPNDPGNDLVVLVDDSAGTDSGSLNVARAALDALVHTLGRDDRIALMFGDLRGHAADGPAGELAPVSTARREAMLDAMAHVRPGGATDLARSLADAYARLDPRRNGSVVYIGDALPTTGPLDAGRIYDETLRTAPDLRLYVIAVGTEAHPEMLEQLASRGGFAYRAMDQADAVTIAQSVAAHASRPLYRDVVLQLGSGVEHPLPDAIDAWVVGDPLRVVGHLIGTEPSEVRVRARALTGPQEWTLPLAIDTIEDTGDLRRRWGLARIRAIEAAGGGEGIAADLGVRFGVLTESTALVLGVSPNAGWADDGTAAYPVRGSLWPAAVLSSRLPVIGVSDSLVPRGIRTFDAMPDYPMVTDDPAGWTRHSLGEWAGRSGVIAYAISSADPAAQACVDRARAVKPRLAGDVTVAATIAADGSVTNATVQSSSLGDQGTESCIRRAVAGLSLPPPSVFGEQPGTVVHTFSFPVAWVSPRGGACPPTARLARPARMALWQERIAAHRGALADVFSDAMWRCELRVWEDRTALLSLIIRAASDPAELVPLRDGLPKQGQVFLDREVGRRWGSARLWRTYLAARFGVDWGQLVHRLSDPAAPIDRKIQLAEAYERLMPWDVDVRLWLMALYEQAGRAHDARRIGDDLRADPYADSSVRALVGEMLMRTGERAEAERAFSEIVEYSPYDTYARQRLGDLLVTYGGQEWANEAYAQYETLSALRVGDPLPRVRMALAAALAQREDEALRILRSVAEDAEGDASTPAVEALLVSEVTRLAAGHPDSPALRAWTRVAALMEIARKGGVVAQWSHPDVALQLRAFEPGDTTFTSVDDAGSLLPVRVFSPGPALEGSRLLVRADAGLFGSRTVRAHLALLEPSPGGPHLAERDVTLSALTPVVALAVRGGQLVDDPTPLPPNERPAPVSEVY